MLALKVRKESVLSESLNLFNKLQSKFVKVAKLEPDSIRNLSVAETLQRAEYLLNDHRSPIISGMLATERYASYLPNKMEDYYK